MWVALLRAVNLGSRNKVPMAGLRRALDDAGYQRVRTYIASGNVVFDHPSPEAGALEALVADAFGVQTTVVLRRAAQIRKLVRSHPFGDDTSTSYVAFLAAKPTAAARRALADVDVTPDRYALVGGDVVLQFPSGYANAQLTAAVLEKTLGVPATARNWRTVEALADLSSSR